MQDVESPYETQQFTICTQNSYLSKNKDIVLKYYFDNSESHLYEQYLS